MLLRFKKTWSVVLIILLFMLLWMLAESYSQKAIGGETDEHGCLGSAGYTWNQTEQTCLREWLSKTDQDYKQKFYCKPEQRKAEACIEIYQPVCGYPLNETFSNSCFACMDEQVEYHIQGECQ